MTTDLKKIPDAETLPDAALERMLNEEDARQLLHITYGYILTDKDAQGVPLFRERLYQLWDENEDAYADVLIKHIGHHVKTLKSLMNKG